MAVKTSPRPSSAKLVTIGRDASFNPSARMRKNRSFGARLSSSRYQKTFAALVSVPSMPNTRRVRAKHGDRTQPDGLAVERVPAAAHEEQDAEDQNGVHAPAPLLDGQRAQNRGQIHENLASSRVLTRGRPKCDRGVTPGLGAGYDWV